MSADQCHDPRRELEGALRDLDLAAVELRRAESVRDRAAELLAEADSAAARFSDLPDRVLAAAVDALKAGTALPAIPDELAVEQRAQIEAGDRLQLARGAHAACADEAVACAARAAEATRACQLAATAVMSAAVGELAGELQRVEMKARELRSLLMSVALVWTPTGDTPKPLPLGSQARTLLTGAPANSRAVADECWTQAWKSWHAELLRNPQAGAPSEPAPAPPPDVTPSVPWPVQQERLFAAQRERIQHIREHHPEANVA